MSSSIISAIEDLIDVMWVKYVIHHMCRWVFVL